MQLRQASIIGRTPLVLKARVVVEPAVVKTNTTEENAKAALELGDTKAALSVLMQGYGNAIFSYCRGMVGPTLVDDVHQLTFVQAYEGLLKFRGQSTFRSWLYGIARHRSLDALRSQKRRIAKSTENTEEPVYPGDLGERVASRQLLQTCLGRLDQKSREAIVLRCQDGLSYTEMANICGEAEPALQMRVARALVRLRKCIEIKGHA